MVLPSSVLRALVLAIALVLTIGAAPARAAEKVFRDEANRTGTIDIRTITLKTTKKRLQVDLLMRSRIKTSLIRDNQAGISMDFEADDRTNVLKVSYVVDFAGAVAIEVCDGFSGCVERRGTIEGKHARFSLPLKRVKNGRIISFSALTVVFGGANQCPVQAGSCPDSLPNNSTFEQWRVPR